MPRRQGSSPPSLWYYKNTFLSDNGAMRQFRTAMEAASVLNPFILKDCSLEKARCLIGMLRTFGFRRFTESFLQKLQNKAGRLITAAKAPYDWDSVEGAEEYNKAPRKKNEKDSTTIQTSREVRYESWEEDPSEKSRRIWYWWKDHKPEFEDFATAVRLVGLVQVSSASVERLFSQLKLVVDSVGQSMLEETLEARLFVLENMIPNGVYLS